MSKKVAFKKNKVEHRYKVSMSKTVSFQKIQFSTSTKYQCQKQFYFKKFSLAQVQSINVKNSFISKNSV